MSDKIKIIGPERYQYKHIKWEMSSEFVTDALICNGIDLFKILETILPKMPLENKTKIRVQIGWEPNYSLTETTFVTSIKVIAE